MTDQGDFTEPDDLRGGWRGVSKRLETQLTPRVGARSARLFASGYRKIWWCFALTVVGAILVVIGGLLSITGIWVSGMAFWVVVLAVAIIGFVEMRRSRSEAEETLGFRLRMGEPPASREKYIQWCKEKEIVPFSADKSR